MSKPQRESTQNKMSASKITDYKTQTIVFRRIDEFELEWKEWYSNKKDDFKTEADALKQWEAMCDGTDGKVVIENEETYGWDECEDKIDEVQNEYETDNYDAEMTRVIEIAEEAFEGIGVDFFKDHSCCNTCGHAELAGNNYVFYHGQNTDDLRKGAREVHLAFSFCEATKPKVLEMIAVHSEMLHWSGKDDTKIYLTCDKELMAEHIKEIAERDVRMAKAAEARAKEARRAELVKQLAELDKE